MIKNEMTIRFMSIYNYSGTNLSICQLNFSLGLAITQTCLILLNEWETSVGACLSTNVSKLLLSLPFL